ncbi:MAG: DUF4405 domain-containing protein [Thermodesulfobacteriota bacterium]
MRKITSLTLLIAGIIELITSVILYIIPSGRVAYWSDYHLLGLSKTQWGDVHITVGALLLLFAALHIYYNWRAITAYLKNKARQLTVFNKHFSTATLISLFVVVGTIYPIPPMNYVLSFGEYLTDLGNEKYGEPPYGHAELSSLKMFCQKMDIELESASQSLTEAGIRFSGPMDSMADIAKNNGKTPQQIFNIIKPVKISGNGAIPFPDSPAPGFGNKRIKDICNSYQLAEEEVLAGLKAAGLRAKPDETVKEIAANNSSNPMAIFEILKEIANR